MAPGKVLCYCKQCNGQKRRTQKTIKKHLEIYGLAQEPAAGNVDDGGDTDWSAEPEDHEADIILVPSDIDNHLYNAHKAPPPMSPIWMKMMKTSCPGFLRTRTLKTTQIEF